MMTIYILYQDPQKTAEYLDDKSLDKQIKDIAQVLCNVHHLESDYINEPDYFDDGIPLDYSLHPIKIRSNQDWVFWARECKANYLYLVELAIHLIKEAVYRKQVFLTNPSKYEKIIFWARDNVPDLPSNCHSCALCYNETNEGCKFCQKFPVLPLIMPKKYIYDNSYSCHISDPNEEKEYTMNSLTCSYRNYYQAKLHNSMLAYLRDDKQKPTWTNRNQPEWIEL